MADRTLTINHADGGSETYTINRDKFAGVRDMVIDGANVSVDHTAVPKEQSRETTFGGSQSITVNRDIEPLLSKVVGGAAAAYSLRDLNDSQGNNNVVRVRRESDNSEKDFKAKEVSNGTMARWVNEQPTLPLDLRELDTNTGERDGALIEAAAAYSLRKLKEDFTGDVVEVRRNVDGETEGFTADEVTDGTLESFVNASFDDELPLDQATGAAAAYSLRSLGSNQWTYGGDTLDYESDFSAGVDGWSPINSTVAGRDDYLEVTVGSIVNQFCGIVANVVPIDSQEYSFSLEFYLPSTNTKLDGIQVIANGGTGGATDFTPTKDQWNTITGTITTGTSDQLRVLGADGGDTTFTHSGGDVIYIRNVKVYENIGDTEYLPSGKYVVQVRRSSDDAVQSFTASEVADGTLESWVNTDLDITNRLIVPSDIATRFVVTSSTDASNYNVSINNDSASSDFAEIRSGLFGEGRYRLRGTLEISDLVGDIKLQTNGGVASGTQFVTLANGTNNLDFEFDITGDGSTTAAGNVRLYFLTQSGTSATLGVSNLTWEVTQADGHVRTWYDQSGSDNHAVQTTPANQPKIVEGGSLVTGGIDFNGAEYLSRSSFTQGDLEQPNTIFSVAKMDSNDDTNRKVYDGDTGAGRNMLFLSPEGSGQFGIYSGSTLLTGDTATSDKHLFTALYNSTSSDFFIDGTSEASGDAGGYSMDAIVIGANHDEALNFWLGQIQEIIIYNSDQSDKRRAIEENIANHYDITLPAFSRDGTVSTWYDQSGNTNHAVQTTVAEQPKIVNAGVLVSGGIKFDAGADTLDLPDVISSINSASSFTVARTTNASATQSALALSRNDPQLARFYAPIATSGNFYFGYGANTTAVNLGSSDTSEHLFTGIAGSSTAEGFIDGTSGGTVSSVDLYSQQNSGGIGSINGTTQWVGTIQEVIIYNTDQTDNRTALEANIGETYGITAIPAANDTVNGYVQSWYDQSGEGNDATQDAAGNQPKIVDGGTLVTRNGDAAIKSTSDNWMTFTLDSLSADGQQSVFGVLENDVTPQDGFSAAFRVSSTSTVRANRRPYWFVNPAGYLAFTVDSLSGYQNSDREYLLYSHIMNNDAGGTSTVHKDGTQVDTRSITLDANATFSSGKVLGVTTNATGALYMSEVIYYTSDQSSNRPAIETNIANQYGITLS